MNGKVQWILYGCLSIIIIISSLSVSTWNYLRSEKTYEEVTQCQDEKSGGSKMDFYSFIVVMLLNGLVVITIQYGNFKMRDGLCEAFYELEANPEGSLLVPFFTACGLLAPSMLMFPLFTVWSPRDCLSLRWTDLIPSFIFNGIQILHLYIPMLVFLAISLEYFGCLTFKMFQVKILLKQRKLNQFLLNCTLNMVITLEKSAAQLSFNFFWIMATVSVQILVLLYLVPANFINYSKVNEPILLFNSVMTLLNDVYFCSLMWIINIRAQKVTDLVHQVKEEFQDIYPDDDLMVSYECQTLPASFMRDRIIQKMNKFTGFDGKGYFILGKSFLKGFLSFCLTYFVILLQFKLSE